MQVVNSLKDAIAPDIMPFVSVVSREMEGKHVIEINVSVGINRPYYIREKGLKPTGVYNRKNDVIKVRQTKGVLTEAI